jgi:hypothetical protein
MAFYERPPEFVFSIRVTWSISGTSYRLSPKRRGGLIACLQLDQQLDQFLLIIKTAKRTYTRIAEPGSGSTQTGGGGATPKPAATRDAYSNFANLV